MRVFRQIGYIALLVLFASGICLSVQANMGNSNIAQNASPVSEDAAIDAFYAARGGEPFWLSSGVSPNKNAKELLAIIEQSWANGLNPNTYGYEEIRSITEGSGRGGKIAEQDRLRFELLLTDAFVGYVRDLSGMRIRARDLGLDTSHWRQRMPAQEALYLLQNHQGDMDEFLLGREPQVKSYQMLKDELVRLLQEEKEVNVPEELLSFKGTVKPGQGATDIPKLRARLGLEEIIGAAKYTYDNDLAAAVIKFQKEKGLKADGIIGQQTLDTLNLTREEKIKRLIVNLERLRWIPEQKPARFMVVNIPSSTLWGIDNGQTAFEMPVVVGRKKRETPSFVTQIEGVRFNPTWTVPPTIKTEDIVPQLQEDPNYFADKGMELFQTQNGETVTVDPQTVDWTSITKKDLANMRMVQTAGDHNPLGRIRVLMPNRHNVYLHDTNHPELFERVNRAQSSGCVRMKYPEKAAQFILSGVEGWSDQKMASVLKSGKTKDYMIKSKIPVYLLYQTIWIGEQDQIVYGNDIYGDDKKLFQILQKLNRAANKNRAITADAVATQEIIN